MNEALAQMHAAAERMERICADLKEFIDGEVVRRREEIERLCQRESNVQIAGNQESVAK